MSELWIDKQGIPTNLMYCCLQVKLVMAALCQEVGLVLAQGLWDLPAMVVVRAAQPLPLCGGPSPCSTYWKTPKVCSFSKITCGKSVAPLNPCFSGLRAMVSVEIRNRIQSNWCPSSGRNLSGITLYGSLRLLIRVSMIASTTAISTAIYLMTLKER